LKWGLFMNLLLLLSLLLLPTSTAEAAVSLNPVASHIAHQAPSGWAKDEVAKRLRPLLQGSKSLKKVGTLWREGKAERAGKELARVLSGNLPPELRMQLEFLQARLELEAEHFEDAAKGFAHCGATNEALRDWCHYYEGLAHYRARKFPMAHAAFTQVSGSFVKGRESTELACISAYYGNDLPGFDQCVAAYSRAHRPTSTLLAMQAQRAYDTGAKSVAAARIKELMARMPNSGGARDVKELVRKLEKEGLGDDLKLSPEERLTRAGEYYDAHDHTAAIRIADKLMDETTEGSEIWCKALGLQAEAWARKREQTRSMPFFDRFVQKCEPYYRAKLLYRGVEAARKAGKLDFAVTWADLLVSRFPTSTLCEDALLFVARMHDRDGNTALVTQVLERILKDFPAGDMVPDAAWLLVWRLYQDGKLDAALAAIDRLAPLLPPRADYRSDGRLDYWAGRIELKKKHRKAARGRFAKVLKDYPLSWYGLLSYLRLEEQKSGRGDDALASARKASKASLPDLQEVLARAGQQGIDLTRVFLFLQLELFEEAQAEVDRALVGGDSSVHSRLLAAFLYHRSGRFPLSHDILRRQLPEFHYTYPLAKDDRWWKIAYPNPFAKLVEEHGKAEQVPWNLIVGIMREESGFSPTIESYAHALGLMQLLQKTASWVAGKPISRGRLRIPAENIPLGAKYIRYLLDKFHHPALAVAGYNSGPGGVAKTLKRVRNREIDEFVETIPYDQTRRYTKRVLSSAWSYQFLYGGKGVVPFNLRFPKQK
jgi:soluble lytic murein transglycosylase